MKIFHLSDLHLGKQLHYYDLGQAQKQMLEDIVDKVKTYQPQVVILAGDIYDKAMPSGEAFTLLDGFLNQLADTGGTVLIIAGNHDSAKRLAFAGDFLKRCDIHVATMPPQSPDEFLQMVPLEDEYGPVNFYLLPFMKPGLVRKVFEDDVQMNYDEAVRRIIEREEIDYSTRNVLVAHQFFVAGEKTPERCKSELEFISVGGLDYVSTDHVKDFDYVALGHIHGPQSIGAEHIRYSGTPLKYSVSEEHHQKSIVMVTLGEKGSPNTYEMIPLTMKPDVRSIKGSLEEVLAAATDENRDDYLQVTLTDDDIYRPKDQLDEVYSHILEVIVDNASTRALMQGEPEGQEDLSISEAFAQFYQEVNGQPMNSEELAVIQGILASQTGGEE